MSKSKAKEENPEIFQEKEQAKEEDIEEIEDLKEEITIDQLFGQILVLKHAEITEGTDFNTVHLVFEDAKGNEIYARTASKAIENSVRRLLNNGLNNGKKFRLCVSTTSNKFHTKTYVFVSPSVCEKVK